MRLMFLGHSTRSCSSSVSMTDVLEVISSSLNMHSLLAYTRPHDEERGIQRHTESLTTALSQKVSHVDQSTFLSKPVL